MKIIRVKWENVVLAILIPLCTGLVIAHNINHKIVWEMLFFEIIVYSMIIYMSYLTMLEIRRVVLDK